MHLATAVEQIATECDLAKSTIGQYKKAVSRYSEFIGTRADSTDLTGPRLNEFVAHLQTKVNNTTAGNYRRALCRVWNFLTLKEGKQSYELQSLRRPRAVDQPVYAWSLEDLQLLLAACGQIDKSLRMGIAVRDYFRALLLTAYDTGLRPSDLFILKWTQYNRVDRAIILIQHKTGKPHIVFLSDEAVAAIEKIRDNRALIFPLTWGGIRRWMEIIFQGAAKRGFIRLPGKNLGTLRKTNATEIYIVDGEAAAAESLGHTSGTRVVRRSYIDHRARRQYSIPRRPNGN